MEFEDQIKADLLSKNVSASSIILYLNNLSRLNDKKIIKNLKFLNNTENILNIISKYKATTQRTYIISALAVISLYKDKYKKIYAEYNEILKNMNTKYNDQVKEHEKTPTQNKNWIEWDDVIKKYDELKLILKNKITSANYNELLNLLVLGVYVGNKPRRARDYTDMKILDKVQDKNFNYVDLKNKIFIFNTFKTSKKIGKQEIKIDDELFNIIKIYLKYWKLNKTNNDFLLKTVDDKPFLQNTTTKILNKIFNKKIASSMLRHIFLSSKYKNISDEQKIDAEEMAHSVDQQKDYIKN